MSLFNYSKQKKKLIFEALAASFVVAFVFAAILPKVFADTAYYFPDAVVELDGANDGSVTISLNTPIADNLVSIQGTFDTSNSGDNFTLTSLTPATGMIPDSNVVADGIVLWQVSYARPFALGARESMWSATYVVDKNTPAGDYSLCFRGVFISSESNGWGTPSYGDLCAQVTVTRGSEPEPPEKPSQVVTFLDSDDNPITEITKYYGDEDFEIKKQVTTGDGEIIDYHPFDDGTGSIVHTVPGTDIVGVGEPSSDDGMQVCAVVEGTANYAETTACYTVYVLKREISINGATITNKTYDGTRDAEVTAVEFSNLGNGTPPTYTAEGTFGTADAGVDKAIRVDVSLTDEAEDHYTLNPSYYNTTKTIEPFGLVRENVELVNGDTYTYDPDGVEPEVRVTVDLYGGKPTLVENQDYEVSYSDNMGVGTGHVTVTGMGNFSTNVPIVLDYTINKKVITVTDATVADKIFDNTPVATVSDVTLSEGSLVYGTDFTATGLFNDVTPAIRNVNVMVALTSDAYAHYCFMYESSCIQNTSYSTIGTILPFTLSNDNAVVELTEDTFVYNGSEQCPAANVRVDLSGNSVKDVVLSAGTDYDVVCDNNVNVGTGATATITGKGNYTGSLEGLTFSITPVTVENVVVTAASQDYTGEPLEPALTVTGTVNGESKTFTTDDYEVVAHEDFVNAGDYIVTINAKDGSNYNIPATSGTFTINKASSGTPAEAGQNLKIETGKTLAELGDLSEGFAWADGSTVVSEGAHEYAATYTKNGDTANYTTDNVSVSVYGLKRIEIATAVFAGGEVTTPGASALEGDEITWTITPNEGYELWRFSVNEEEKTDEVSGGRFTMTAGTEDIMAIVYFRRVYQFVDGMGQKHIRGVDGAAVFEVDADYELFEDGGRVYVDGEQLSEEYYRTWSGSTMIELSAEYLGSLEPGEHTLELAFNDGGVARTTFVIADPEVPEEESPAAADTGVFTGADGGAVVTGASIVAAISLIGVAFGVKSRKKA